jgi:hypothetical protein
MNKPPEKKILFEGFNKNSNKKLRNNDLIANIETNIHSDYFYLNGYFNAGEIIFNNWIDSYQKENDGVGIDYIIYPIYFCYRQSIEIYIKKILRTLGIQFEKKHNIKTLYLKLEEKLGEETKFENNIDNFIKILDDNDSSFTRFRYDVDKKGERHEKLSVDILGMVNGFRITYYFFDELWKTKFGKDSTFQKNHYSRF